MDNYLGEIRWLEDWLIENKGLSHKLRKAAFAGAYMAYDRHLCHIFKFQISAGGEWLLGIVSALGNASELKPYNQDTVVGDVMELFEPLLMAYYEQNGFHQHLSPAGVVALVRDSMQKYRGVESIALRVEPRSDTDGWQILLQLSKDDSSPSVCAELSAQTLDGQLGEIMSNFVEDTREALMRMLFDERCLFDYDPRFPTGEKAYDVRDFVFNNSRYCRRATYCNDILLLQTEVPHCNNFAMFLRSAYNGDENRIQKAHEMQGVE